MQPFEMHHRICRILPDRRSGFINENQKSMRNEVIA